MSLASATASASVCEGRDREDRPEDLLAGEALVVRASVDDRRLDEAAASSGPLAAVTSARFSATDVEVASTLLEVARADSAPMRFSGSSGSPIVPLAQTRPTSRSSSSSLTSRGRSAARSPSSSRPCSRRRRCTTCSATRSRSSASSHHELRVLAASSSTTRLRFESADVAQEAPPGLGRAGEADHVDVGMPADRLADARGRCRSRR